MGLLLVLIEVPRHAEDELNEWYDEDHIPERLAISGFRTATRFISSSRAGRYLALYDLDSVDILETPAYLAYAGDNFTPWTKRVRRIAKFTRMIGRQIFPGDEGTSTSSRLLLLRFDSSDEPGALTEAARASFEGHPGVLQTRVFASDAPGGDDNFILVAGHGDLESALPATLGGGRLRLRSVEAFHSY